MLACCGSSWLMFKVLPSHIFCKYPMLIQLDDEGDQSFLDRHLAPCLLSLYSPDLSTCPPVHTSPLLSTYPISPRLCAPQPHHTPHIPQSCLFPLFSPFQCPCPLPSLPALCPHIQPPLSLTEDICTERGTHVQETKAHDAEDYTGWSTRMEQIMAIHETELEKVLPIRPFIKIPFHRHILTFCFAVP